MTGRVHHSGDRLQARAAASMPRLTRQERYAHEELCDRALCDSIAALAGYNGSMDATDWQMLESRDQLAVYKRTRNDGDVTRLVGTGYIHGRIDYITSALYSDTDHELVAKEAVLSGDAVRDGSVLQTFERRGPETPFRYAGVKWYAGMTHDLLTYERMGVTLDSDNLEVAYHIVSAVSDHSDWPKSCQLRSLSHRKRVVPAGLRRVKNFVICYLYRKVAEDLVLCFVMGEYWGTTSIRSQQGVEQTIVDRILMVSNAVACYDAKILTRLMLDCENHPVHVSKTCLRCRYTRRTVLDPLGVCGICRKSVCQACRSNKLILDINENTRRARTTIFCTKCLYRTGITSDTLRPTHELHQYRDHSTVTRHASRMNQSERIATRREDASACRHYVYSYDGIERRREPPSFMTPVLYTDDKRAHTRVRKEPSPCRQYAGACAPTRMSKDGWVDTTSSSDDLYLSRASSEAQRRYRLFLERTQKFGLDSSDYLDSTSSPGDSSSKQLIWRSQSDMTLTSSEDRTHPNQDFRHDLYRSE